VWKYTTGMLRISRTPEVAGAARASADGNSLQFV
jgi:hypothetical protein